jgi:hypothetical protein
LGFFQQFHLSENCSSRKPTRSSLLRGLYLTKEIRQSREIATLHRLSSTQVAKRERFFHLSLPWVTNQCTHHDLPASCTFSTMCSTMCPLATYHNQWKIYLAQSQWADKPTSIPHCNDRFVLSSLRYYFTDEHSFYAGKTLQEMFGSFEGFLRWVLGDWYIS